MVCFFLCSSDQPQAVKAKGMKNAQYSQFMDMAGMPHTFALGLKDAPCQEPKCCILGACGTPCCLTPMWARKAVLDKYGNGIQDFVFFQNVIPGCCCLDFATICPGSEVGLALEACCCPMISLSVARIHMMRAKQIRPDPMDWQIIECSNFLQIVSCILDLAASATDVPALDQAALIVDIIADAFTLSVAGCMAAQVHHEIMKGPPVVHGVPVVMQAIVVPPPTVSMTRA